jgi:hypothetical protein
MLSDNSRPSQYDLEDPTALAKGIDQTGLGEIDQALLLNSSSARAFLAFGRLIRNGESLGSDP